MDDNTRAFGTQKSRRVYDQVPPPLTVWLRVPGPLVPVLIERARAAGLLADQYALDVLIATLNNTMNSASGFG